MLRRQLQTEGFSTHPILLKGYKEPLSIRNTEPSDTRRSQKNTLHPWLEGMANVVKIGTARIAQIPGVEVCGKTGTIENFTRINGIRTQLTDHSMFIAFAPKDNPKIAIAVIVENGYWGGRWAAPIASLVIEKYPSRGM